MLVGLTASVGAGSGYATSVRVRAGENFTPYTGAGALDEVLAAAAAADAAAAFHVSEAVVRSGPEGFDCGYAIALAHSTSIIAATDAPNV